MVWDHGPGRVRIEHQKATEEFLLSFVSEDLPKRPFEEVTALETSERQNRPPRVPSRIFLFCDSDPLVKEISTAVVVSVTSV